MMLGRLIEMLLKYIFGFEKLEKGSPEDTKMHLFFFVALLSHMLILLSVSNIFPKTISKFFEQHIYVASCLLGIYVGLFIILYHLIAHKIPNMLLWILSALLCIIFAIKAIYDFNHI